MTSAIHIIFGSQIGESARRIQINHETKTTLVDDHWNGCLAPAVHCDGHDTVRLWYFSALVLLEGLKNVERQEAKGIKCIALTRCGRRRRSDLFLSSPSATTQDQSHRVMHIYSPTPDGKSYVYLGKLALAGFRHDETTARLVGIEVDISNGNQTLKGYSVNAKGLAIDRDIPTSSDASALDKAKAEMVRWMQASQKQWWQIDLAALQANVWERASIKWTGEASGEQHELPNALFNAKVSRDHSPGKNRAKSSCTMK